MDYRKPEIIDHGIVIEHDLPCAICGQESAVYDMQKGYFKPGWNCQKEGWRISKRGMLAKVFEVIVPFDN